MAPTLTAPYDVAVLTGRHDSQTPGEEGITGPYVDGGLVDDGKDPAVLVSSFHVGLAEGTPLDGRWDRLSEPQPGLIGISGA